MLKATIVATTIPAMAPPDNPDFLGSGEEAEVAEPVGTSELELPDELYCSDGVLGPMLVAV